MELSADRTFDASECAFQTAVGEAISISQSALSKVKQRFQDELEDSDTRERISELDDESEECQLEANAAGRSSVSSRGFSTAGQSTNVFSCAFQTAVGEAISISQSALSQVKLRFPDELEELDVLGNVSPCGFTTAGGQSVDVSATGLSKAKGLFVDDLQDADLFEQTVEKEAVKHAETEASNIAFTSTGRRPVNATNMAAPLERKCPEKFPRKNFHPLHPSLQKRKLKDLDDDVSAPKNLASDSFKKLRFIDGFHVKKDSGKTIKKDGDTVSSYRSPNDGDSAGENCKSRADVGSLISDEILASANALIVDEKNSVVSERWSSKEESNKEDIADSPCSPVLGRQFGQRKRKSAARQKRRTASLSNEKSEPCNAAALKQHVNNNVTDVNHCTEVGNKEPGEGRELVDRRVNCDSTLVASSFGDTQLMIDFIDGSAKILEKRLKAALEQEKEICLKKRSKVKQIASKLFSSKQLNRNNRVTWKEYSGGCTPILRSYKELTDEKLSPEILDVTADTALAYKFRCADFYGQEIQSNVEGVQMEDGGCLILDENGYVGILEIKRSFLASPGVDPNLLCDGWVENHYRWIVWKFASMDRVKFGSVNLPRALTPARVMSQLKYRYDREIDRVERSALRKILEKDDVASKTMVLCVSSISEQNDSAENENSKPPGRSARRVTLTDGWYSIPAALDAEMMKHIASGKVREGTKLVTCGAELLNCEQGSAPLEALPNVGLKIHTNATRRARWDAKLGYVAPPGPLRAKLKNVCPNGGFIGKIVVTIARVYPLVYHEKTSTGESIVRNARSEEKVNIAYEKECRSKIEAFYAEAEQRYFTGKRSSFPEADSLDFAAMEWNKDRERLSTEKFRSKREQEQLVDQCREKEKQFRRELESKLQESLPPARKVTPLLRVRVAEGEANAILSVWSPSEEVADVLKEGHCVAICNLVASGQRGGELQLTASRNALFFKKIANAPYPARSCTALCDIDQSTFTPTYGEFDTVGIVAYICNEPYGMKNFETVYLAYPNANSSSYLSVLFWQGTGAYGYTEILTVGSVVACSNLECRRATSWSIPMAYCTERSGFTRNPKQRHLQRQFEELRTLIPDTADYIAKCVTEITEEMQKRPTPRATSYNKRNQTNDGSANEVATSDRQTQKSPIEKMLTDRRTMAKSAAVQKRLDKLQFYEEPGQLSPIVLKCSSKRISSQFEPHVVSSNAKQKATDQR